MSWMEIKATRSHRKKIMVCGCPIPVKERKIPGYNCQLATGRAITGSRDNDTPVQSQVERKYPSGIKTPQPMRAAPGDPRRGANPVELVSSQSFGDFPMFAVKAVDM